MIKKVYLDEQEIEVHMEQTKDAMKAKDMYQKYVDVAKRLREKQVGAEE